MIGVPDLDTVFSQARNGRIKRLEESLNLGNNESIDILNAIFGSIKDAYHPNIL